MKKLSECCGCCIEIWIRLKNFYTNYFTLFLFLCMGLTILTLVLFWFQGVIGDQRTGITLLTALPLFVFTILQYLRSQQIQRASYIKDFLNEFRKNEQIYETYYDLVYSYTDDLFEKVENKALEYKQRFGQKVQTKDKPIFACFHCLQKDRTTGSRLYYPEFFQFSPEERRLDGLLDYFNYIGFYYYEGLIEIEIIAGLLGDYLAVIENRQVIKTYLKLCNEGVGWKYQGFPPYFYLSFLLISFKEYKLKTYHKKRHEILKNAIETKKKKAENKSAGLK